MRKINKYFNLKGGENEDEEEEESSDEELDELVDFEEDVIDNSAIEEDDDINIDTNKCALKDYTMSQWPIIDNVAAFSQGIDNYFKERGYIKKKPIAEQNNCLSKKVKTECHHNLPSDYISPGTPYRGLILFHSLGSGKTLTSFKIISKFIDKEPGRDIYFITPPGITAYVSGEISKFHKLLPNNFKERVNIKSYISFANRLSGETEWDIGPLKGKRISEKDSFDALLENSLIVMDEAHNINDTSNTTIKNSFSQIYTSIRKAKNIRVVLLTGTPIKNKPYEISKLINLLKFKDDRYQLPISEREFNQMFVYNGNYINNSNMPFFIRTIMGTLSYYDVTGDTTRFARKEFFEKKVEMSDEQFKIWKRGSSNRSQNGLCTQGGCLSDSKLSNVLQGYQQTDNLEKCFENINKCSPKVKSIYDTIEDNINYKHFVYSKYNAYGVRILTEYLKHNNWKQITKSKIYKIFKNANDVLKLDWKPSIDEEYLKKFTTENGNNAFLVLEGDEDTKRYELLVQKLYNLPQNKRGVIAKVIIAGEKYKEGISLMDTNFVHILEPPINEADKKQIVGRVVRNCSHKNLSYPEEWFVNVHMYYAVLPDNRVGNCKNITSSNECDESDFCKWDDENGNCTSLSTDETFSKIADNNNLVSKFLQILKQASVDCVVNSVANNSGVNCSFDPTNPLRKITSQFKENMEDDRYQSSCDKINTKEKCDKSQSCYWKPESVIRGSTKYNFCHKRQPDTTYCGDHKTETDCSLNSKCSWDQTRVDINFGLDPCVNKYEKIMRRFNNCILFNDSKTVYQLEEFTGSEIKYQLDILKSNITTTQDITNRLSILQKLMINYPMSYELYIKPFKTWLTSTYQDLVITSEQREMMKQIDNQRVDLKKFESFTTGDKNINNLLVGKRYLRMVLGENQPFSINNISKLVYVLKLFMEGSSRIMSSASIYDADIIIDVTKNPLKVEFNKGGHIFNLQLLHSNQEITELYIEYYKITQYTWNTALSEYKAGVKSIIKDNLNTQLSTPSKQVNNPTVPTSIPVPILPNTTPSPAPAPSPASPLIAPINNSSPNQLESIGNLSTVTIPYYNPSNNELLVELNNNCQKDYNECVQKLNQMRTKGELSDVKFDTEMKKCKDILSRCRDKIEVKECELKKEECLKQKKRLLDSKQITIDKYVEEKEKCSDICNQPTQKLPEAPLNISDVNITLSNFTEVNQLQQDLNNLNNSLQESFNKCDNKYNECYQKLTDMLNKKQISNDKYQVELNKCKSIRDECKKKSRKDICSKKYDLCLKKHKLKLDNKQNTLDEYIAEKDKCQQKYDDCINNND